MYTITYADNHVEIVESHLMFLNFSLDSSMLSGYCKNATTSFSSNSPSSNTFFICREIVDLLR